MGKKLIVAGKTKKDSVSLDSGKDKNVALFFFLSFDLSGKLGPIFKVPCSNNFLFRHYCHFCNQNPVHHVMHWRQFLLP